MPRRVALVLKVFVVLAVVVAIMFLYSTYRTVGEYSAEIVFARVGDAYTVERVIVQAKPERLQGDYFVTLVFHIRVTLETTMKSLPESVKEEAARQYIEVACPAEYGYRLGASSLVEKVTVGASTRATFDIPVYVTVKGFKVRLEPGKESTVDMKLKPGCIIIREYMEPYLMLDPVAGGFVINIKNVRVSVKG